MATKTKNQRPSRRTNTDIVEARQLHKHLLELEARKLELEVNALELELTERQKPQRSTLELQRAAVDFSTAAHFTVAELLRLAALREAQDQLTRARQGPDVDMRRHAMVDGELVAQPAAEPEAATTTQD